MGSAVRRSLGRYQTERLLGRGASADVWAAVDPTTGALVALKVPHDPEPETLRRFRREAKILAALAHPNVPRLVEAAEDGSFIAMELADGDLLSARLARGAKVELAEAASIFLQVVSAVGHAHALGILHRDVKPENIVVTHDGGVKVLDFGIAKLHRPGGLGMSATPLTRTGAVLGTPYTMAPEQAFGEPSIDHRADVWAIGVCLYHALAGRRPVDGVDRRQIYRVLLTGAIAPLAAVAPWVPRDILRLSDQMLVVEPAQRMANLCPAYDVLSQHTNASAPRFAVPVPVRDA